MAGNFIETTAAVAALVDTISNAPRKPLIFIDLEGVNLSRHGSISMMQVLVPPTPVVNLIDIHTLRAEAFSTSGATGNSLRSILESDDYPKAFFDVRNDSDALYSHFNIHLRGIIDIQLVEFASRPGPSRLLNGLAKCITKAGQLNWSETQEWQRVKAGGQAMFAPERGGSYEVFNQRPLPPIVQEYCIQDVLILPKLLLSFAERLEPHMPRQIQVESIRRVELSQSSSFNGTGRHMAQGPYFSWARNGPALTSEFPCSILCSGELQSYCELKHEELEVGHDGSALASSTASEVTSESSLADSPITEPEPDSLLAPAVQAMSLGGAMGESTASLEYNDERDQGEVYYGRSDSDRSSPSSEKDFTACSANDCGYCGHCEY